jgi:hypothetical protein
MVTVFTPRPPSEIPTAAAAVYVRGYRVLGHLLDVLGGSGPERVARVLGGRDDAAVELHGEAAREVPHRGRAPLRVLVEVCGDHRSAEVQAPEGSNDLQRLG